MKKVISILLCMMLVLSMAFMVSAEQANTTITIQNGAANSVYSLYRILDASQATIDGTEAFGYSVNQTYDAAFMAVLGTNDSTAVYQALTGLTTAALDEFAENIYEQIKDKSIPADETINGNSTVSVPQGYYLIVETTTGGIIGGQYGEDSQSLHMVYTAGKTELKISTKESWPTLDKVVEELNDSKPNATTTGMQEYASYDIGDTITYKVVTTVNSKFDSFDSYYYSLSDTMGKGLTLDITSVQVFLGGVEGIEITDKFTITEVAADAEGNHGFTATADLLKIKNADNSLMVSHNSNIVFVYKATLNENAVIGTAGNPNTAVLTYQTNPYVTIDPTATPPTDDVGETPEDTNIVFTFALKINKKDGSGNPLNGAGFTLYKFNAAANEYQEVEEIELPDGNFFEFKGLDEGMYKLEETTLPGEGYNQADPIEFHIHAVYDTTANPVKLVGLKAVNSTEDVIGATYLAGYEPDDEVIINKTFEIELTAGDANLVTDVINTTGRELPSTGGMGTTMLYAAGAVLVLAAVVMLVTKKRMASAE